MMVGVGLKGGYLQRVNDRTWLRDMGEDFGGGISLKSERSYTVKRYIQWILDMVSVIL